MDDNSQQPQNDTGPEADAIRAFLYSSASKLPSTVTADELRDALRLDVARMSFLSLRDQFVKAAIPKLSQRLNDLDITSTQEKIDEAKAINIMLTKNVWASRFYNIALVITPKAGRLHQTIKADAALFYNEAANEAAHMLKIAFGERAASQTLPQRLRSDENAQICDQLKMHSLAGLIRRSMQFL